MFIFSNVQAISVLPQLSCSSRHAAGTQEKSAVPWISCEDGGYNGEKGSCVNFQHLNMMLWGNSVWLAWLDHGWSLLPQQGHWHGTSVGAQKGGESRDFLRDLNKRSVHPLWLTAGMLEVKTSLFPHRALMRGCFDSAVPWPFCYWKAS